HEMYRECAYLDISYDSAARIGEVLQIKKDGLLERRYTNIVVGKRGKKFRLLYHYNSLESLKLYLNSREDNIEALWIDQDHNHAVTDNTLYDWCIKMRSILHLIEGKYIPFTPHSFRHSALENYKSGTHYMCEKMGRPEGFSIEEIQILAHHDNIDTTKSYLKPNDNNILESMFGIKLE
ncbi:MAG: site-specific integrase, partial [Zhenhengia sp.]